MKEKILNKFRDLISSITIKNDLVEIESIFDNLDDVSALSKKITDYIATIDETFLQKYNIEVFSKGTEIDINQHNLQNFVENKLKVVCNKTVNKHNEYIGQIIEHNNEFIVIKWNAKGQFRKQQITWDDIDKIELYI
ncbi:Uncharacterised BCR, YhbC family COG0779 [Mycoplasmopsis californica]|uniref:Ribosome maturation factor RimP n=1 Tax=Mycoplasmopsis equigenitalium TaxID=114883 RepID=A0ABY5J0D3_9BACT|nr:hypothetical protein [Mycoplasmopsis equigenitalium]UUD36718.1 hypothetical protein NPA09_02315 [Mycoplasmopsis equigenitalium]VEU69987.1 Uncharacterised BCR, YhbC family COG0779 [Mycoplasmopsis californica]